MYTVYYRNYSVGCPNSEIILLVAAIDNLPCIRHLRAFDITGKVCYYSA
jgi:hypothetical protein